MTGKTIRIGRNVKRSRQFSFRRWAHKKRHNPLTIKGLCKTLQILAMVYKCPQYPLGESCHNCSISLLCKYLRLLRIRYLPY
jgi:hypothetical protein